ncbi:phosphotransferase [Actinomadura sp. WMMA1423]|uniref:phosphotransferase n=1 Tax=Actinomadura sp. WMMA1423 TaxID=2591108 RepID=UPI001F0FB69D
MTGSPSCRGHLPGRGRRPARRRPGCRRQRRHSAQGPARDRQVGPEVLRSSAGAASCTARSGPSRTPRRTWRSSNGPTTPWRRRCLPTSAPALVHSDFRLGNCVVGGTGEVCAVLDWETCTLGKPLADLATLLVGWNERDDEDLLGLAELGIVPTAAEGFPPRAEVIAAYSEESGRTATGRAARRAGGAATRAGCARPTRRSGTRAGAPPAAHRPRVRACAARPRRSPRRRRAPSGRTCRSLRAGRRAARRHSVPPPGGPATRCAARPPAPRPRRSAGRS